ncbi:uncharacterized protein B0H18DRAFT_971064 [Fomitopsis serialis]|uniref:uncharacterized protein n=1 Tax=Fomitopsis serialis TaxID=139415 RepID=UPI002007FC18|nr:uncharacterized protein B0H18DRAFT_971064 [Neoantrodia serialis]KAH9937529.1 hypothetical protein B0H18DRAFT_971064 [Neoantrodia serialis]
MASTSTRSPPNAYSSYEIDPPPLQHRVSRKSSRTSFLSLKRTKKKSVSSIDPSLPSMSPTPGQSRVGDESMSPSSFHSLQDPSEAILTGVSRQGSRQGRHSRRSSRSSRQDQVSLHSARTRSSERQRGKKKVVPSQIESQPFPTMGGYELSMSDDRYARRRSRSQRHTGSSYLDDFDELAFHNRPFNISLVDSASSVLSHYDAPQTPVDDHLFRDPVYTLPVVVAAPVPGVETMDALVDGMNDSFSDDHYTGSGGLSGRKKASKTGHHPLYHPPLPKPPPGVVLGRVGQTATSPRSQDSDEDEETEHAPVRSWSEQREHRKKRRPASARSPPTITSTSSHPVYPSRPARSVSTRSSRHSSIAPSALDPSTPPRPPTPPRPGSILFARSPPSISTATPTNQSIIAKEQTTPTSYVLWSRPTSTYSSTSGPSPNSASFTDSSYTSQETSVPSITSQETSVPSTSVYDSYHIAGPSRAVAPSISEIIRAHAPPAQRARSRKSSYARSFGHEMPARLPQPSKPQEEAYPVSRSSVDTIAEEVQRTLSRVLAPSPGPRPLHLSRSFPRLPVSQIDTRNGSSTRSEGRRESSIFSYSTTSDQPPIPGFDLSTLTKPPTNSPSQAIAQYLRSARLTTLLPLTRFPHASEDHPLNVSLSDLGSPTGHPVVVFLGLGCVRHIMGLYDEMAECLNIRLITIDRWGLGRTDSPRSKSARGIPEWAHVVEEVLDRLKIDQCSVMAHSAGAPYALAFANKYPERVRGEVCLLAPWVGGGEGAGYKWLKYVPNGILKTAQAAEWKIQAWMIGKPPSFQFEGIGFDASSPVASPVASKSPVTSPSPIASRSDSTPTPTRQSTSHLETKTDVDPRPSISSIAFSEYDDLRDFDGCFESQTSLGRKSTNSDQKGAEATSSKAIQRKASRSFLGRLKSGQPQSPQDGGHRSGTKLKVLRSMGNLKGKKPSPTSPAGPPPVPRLPSPLPQANADVGLGLDNLDLDGLDFSDTIRIKSTSTPPAVATSPSSMNAASIDFPDDDPFALRANGRRSISLCVGERPALPIPEADDTPASFQAMLGNALILNHDRQPWGFSYAAYPHTVRVWYGEHDERIAENAVRWMENTMGRDRCFVKVIEGADHALMYKGSVVIEVLENISEFWRDREFRPSDS